MVNRSVCDLLRSLSISFLCTNTLRSRVGLYVSLLPDGAYTPMCMPTIYNSLLRTWRNDPLRFMLPAFADFTSAPVNTKPPSNFSRSRKSCVARALVARVGIACRAIEPNSFKGVASGESPVAARRAGGSTSFAPTE